MIKKIYSIVIKLLFRPKLSCHDEEINFIFHSISHQAKDKSIYSMSKKKFEELVHIVKKLQIAHKSQFNKDLKIIFTFDDGYKDFIINALPVLKKNRMNSIVFIIGSNIFSGRKEFISFDDLDILRENNVKIGMHGYSHIKLDTLSHIELKKEISNLQHIIKKAKLRTSMFSLPFGGGNDLVFDFLKNAGFNNVYTSSYGSGVAFKSVKLYKRIDIWSIDNHQTLIQKMENFWDLYYFFDNLKSKVYRVK